MPDDNTFQIVKYFNNIYVSTFGHVYISKDNGLTFQQSSDICVGVQSTVAVRGKNIFYGTNGYGVYLSTDDGLTWNSINNGLNTLKIWSMTIKDNDIFIGTDNGVYKSNINEFNISNIEGEKSESLMKIKSQIVSDYLELENVSLSQNIEIYSLLGDLIFNVVGESHINICNLAPGMYFIKIGDKLEKFVKM